MFLSCKKESKDIDISNVEIEVYTLPFHQLLQDSLSKKLLQNIQNKHPEFVDAYYSQVIGVTDKTQFFDATKEFVQYFDTTGINDLINDRFINISSVENQFLLMQKRLSVLIPDYNPYDLITMNSGFNFKHFLVSDAVAVGLDMYLGDTLQYSQISPNYFDYMQHTFTPDYLLPEVATTIVTDLYPSNPQYSTFLDRMIYQGKLLYFLELILPDNEMHTIISMNKESYDWCVQNEENIYRYFIANELLYSKDIHEIKTYITDGPFSKGMPQESPGNTGSYLGWQIVKSYMKNRESTEIIKLMEEERGIEIFNNAKYTPN